MCRVVAVYGLQVGAASSFGADWLLAYVLVLVGHRIAFDSLLLATLRRKRLIAWKAAQVRICTTVSADFLPLMQGSRFFVW